MHYETICHIPLVDEIVINAQPNKNILSGKQVEMNRIDLIWFCSIKKRVKNQFSHFHSRDTTLEILQVNHTPVSVVRYYIFNFDPNKHNRTQFHIKELKGIIYIGKFIFRMFKYLF